MENVKEIIAKNLTELRKSRGWTQSTLAEKLNYSDKAISRWEHAETLPDIETLCRICDIYGVNFEYLLNKSTQDIVPQESRSNRGRRVIMCLIAVCAVWLAVTALFTMIGALTSHYIWQLFIWAIPASGLAVVTCNKKWWHSKTIGAIFASINNWTVILSIYLQFISHNIWLLFVVGAPIQVIIILSATMPEKKG